MKQLNRVPGPPHRAEAAVLMRGPTPYERAGLRPRAVCISLGFSLVELVCVTAVIGVLAGLLLPAVIRERVQAKKQRARLEMAQIESALTAYQSLYGRFPISRVITESTAAMDEDMTYGAFLLETCTWLAGPCYYCDNSELMPGLVDLEYYTDGNPTPNRGHVQNPGRTKFLEATMREAGTNAVPGLGVDGVFRDPWGGPYIITLDLNGDGRTRDVMYSKPAVSQDSSDPGRGLLGLVKGTNAQGEIVFEAPGSMLVWSAGPDRKVSSFQKANEGFNRDNILSWR